MRTFRFTPIAGMVLVSLLILSGPGVPARADVPTVINYQGCLVDTDGNPVSDGSYTMFFYIYDDSVGGNLLWGEMQSPVIITDGLFNVLLGSVVSLTPEIFEPAEGDVSDSQVRYLEIKVGLDPPISPRTEIASHPYSLVAYRLKGDVNTTQGKLELITDIGGGGQYIYYVKVDSNAAEIQMESTDGSSLTKSTDRSSPNLLTATKKKTSIRGDSSIIISKVTDTEAEITMESADGSGLTKSTDRSSPSLLTTTKKKESTAGDSSIIITKVDDTGAEITMESADGSSLTKSADRSSPSLLTTTKKKKSTRGDSSLIEVIIDEEGIDRVLMVEDDFFSGRLTEDVSLNAIIKKETYATLTKGAHREPDSAVALTMVDSTVAEMAAVYSYNDTVNTAFMRGGPLGALMGGICSGGSAVIDSIALGGGGEGPYLDLYHYNPTVPTRLDPVGYVRLAAEDGGGSFILSHQSTGEEGLNADIGPSYDYIRLRKGSINSSVYIRADSANGGRIGINNEAPTEALQVSGNICASGSIGECSDARFKTDIASLTGALNKINQLHGVSFNWNSIKFPELRFREDRQVGFIAQDIAEIIPEVVLQDDDGYYSVDYGKLTPLLVEAIKEQQAIIDQLKNELEELKESVNRIITE